MQPVVTDWDFYTNPWIYNLVYSKSAYKEEILCFSFYSLNSSFSTLITSFHIPISYRQKLEIYL